MDAANKKIGAYSKGMRQRVKLAQALVHDPELLILDEPLTGMDPLMRRKTVRFIKDWARAGKHIVVSSHILSEISETCDRILVIKEGKIEWSGTESGLSVVPGGFFMRPCYNAGMSDNPGRWFRFSPANSVAGECAVPPSQSLG